MTQQTLYCKIGLKLILSVCWMIDCNMLSAGSTLSYVLLRVTLTSQTCKHIQQLLTMLQFHVIDPSTTDYCWNIFHMFLNHFNILFHQHDLLFPLDCSDQKFSLISTFSSKLMRTMALTIFRVNNLLQNIAFLNSRVRITQSCINKF